MEYLLEYLFEITYYLKVNSKTNNYLIANWKWERFIANIYGANDMDCKIYLQKKFGKENIKIDSVKRIPIHATTQTAIDKILLSQWQRYENISVEKIKEDIEIETQRLLSLQGAKADWYSQDKVINDGEQSKKEETQVCVACRNELPLSDFHRDATAPNGHNNRCKVCIKLYQEAYRAKKLEIQMKEKQNEK